MAVESTPPLEPNSDHHTPPSPRNVETSISELRNLTAALSTFQRRYDELQQHLDFIETTINSKLPNPLPTTFININNHNDNTPPTHNQSNPHIIPISPFPQQQFLHKTLINSPHLTVSEQNPNNNNNHPTSAPSTSTNPKSQESESKPDNKLPHSVQASDIQLPNSVKAENPDNELPSSVASLEPKKPDNEMPNSVEASGPKKSDNELPSSVGAFKPKKPNNELSNSVEVSKPKKPDNELANSVAKAVAGGGGDEDKGAESDLQKLCSSMCSRGLRRYFSEHLSELNKLRVEAPEAMKLAPDPAKLVFDCVGKFYLQGKKAFAKGSSMIKSREASLFAMECFLIMGIDGVSIKHAVKEEAKAAAIAWKKRLLNEGGLSRACEDDARGLLLLIGCFGIPGVFKNDEIRFLIRSSNAKGITGALLRRSSVLMAKISEIIKAMLDNEREIEAVDMIYKFEFQEKFPPSAILSLFFSRSSEIWSKKRKAAENSLFTLNEGNKHLAHLKSLVKCLEDNKIDPSKSFPELEIYKKVSSFEKEIAVLDRSIRENATTKKPENEAESSKRLKTPDVMKHSRVSGHASQLQKATGEADGKSSYDILAQVDLNGGMLPGRSFNASPSVPHGSGVGLGLLHEYAGVTRAGGGGSSLVAAGIGGSISAGAGAFMSPDPYAMSQRNMYGWRRDAAANERLISHTYHVQQPSSVGYNGLYRPSQSLEGFAGLPDRPSAVGGLMRGSNSDLYQFTDSVIESELQRMNASRPGSTSHHKTTFL